MGLSMIPAGVQVKVYNEVSFSSLLKSPPSTSPLMIVKETRLVSSTWMEKEDVSCKDTVKESGPVIAGGKLATEMI